MASVVPAETTARARLVGVSSAPARTFIEQAARKASVGSSGLGFGTSPTVLSILAQRGSDDTFTGRHTHAAHGAPVAGAADAAKRDGGVDAVSSSLRDMGLNKTDVPEGGLSASLRRGVPTTTGPAPMSSAGVTHVPTAPHAVLSASFRDPSRIPMQVTITEEDEGVDDDVMSSDDERAGRPRKSGKKGAAAGARDPTPPDADDDDDSGRQRRRLSSVAEPGRNERAQSDEDLFQADF